MSKFLFIKFSELYNLLISFLNKLKFNSSKYLIIVFLIKSSGLIKYRLYILINKNNKN